MGYNWKPVKYKAPISLLSTFSWAGTIKIVTCQPEKNRKKVYRGKNLHAHWGCLSLAEEAGVKCSVDRKACRRLVTFWVAASSDSDFLICQCYLFSWPWFEIARHTGNTVILSHFTEKKKKKTTVTFADELWFQRFLFLCTKSLISVILPWFGVNSGSDVKTIQNWGLKLWPEGWILFWVLRGPGSTATH